MNINELQINQGTTIIEALKRMDEIGRKLLIVVEGDRYFGLLSIGDIQRAILEKTDLSEPIERILRKEVKSAAIGSNLEELKKEMLKNRIEFMPIVDAKNEIVEVLFWDDLFKEEIKYHSKIDIPVVIMAGGKGSRMKPFTDVLPKAMIPVHEHTVIEEIMEKFKKYGVTEFYISVNHQADLIENYLISREYNIEFIREEKPLGTAGSLFLLKDKFDDNIFVINCDTLIFEDYFQMLKFHKENNNKITIISALRSVKIPFGVIETEPGGIFKKIEEKPEYNFQINSGFYLLNHEVLDYIPENQKFDMPELIEKAQIKGDKIGVFPISEKSWQDLGQWEFYKSFIRDFNSE
ncbi:MAG: NTP transferase domain-containing protein [Saprospiraceae bacterium]|nr:NTP transferase domain-containing protein [Saprospiraceae bacterium]